MDGARAEQITGLVLAGGRGQRIGGADNGWVPFRGRSLIETVEMHFAAGGRARHGWLVSLDAVAVDFDGAAAFRSIHSAAAAGGRAA
jgi:hypothetical protein